MLIVKLLEFKLFINKIIIATIIYLSFVNY